MLTRTARRYITSIAAIASIALSSLSAGAAPEPPAPLRPAPLRYEPPALPARPAPRWRETWYGWQILIPTLAFDATLLVGVLVDAPELSIAAFVGRGLTGPIVHAVHGLRGTAPASYGQLGGTMFLSLMLEAGLPSIPLVLLTTATNPGGASSPGPDFGERLWALLLLPVLFTAGTIIDTSVLSTKTEEIKPAQTSRLGVTDLALLPFTAPPPTGLRPVTEASRREPTRATAASLFGPPVGLTLAGRF